MSGVLASGGEVPSPCVGICAVNDDEICCGCGRSLDEIAAWSQAGSAVRQSIVQVAAQRMEQGVVEA